MVEVKLRLQRMFYLLRGGDGLRGVEDEDTARSFHLILTALLAWLAIFIALVLPIFVVRKAAVAAIGALLTGTALTSLALLRQRRKRAASAVFLCVIWCVINGFTFFNRGVHSAAVGWSFVLIMLAGWLLGRSYALGFTAASTSVFFIEAVLEAAGHPLPNYFPSEPISMWATYLLFVALAIILILSILDELRIQISAFRESEERFSSLSDAAIEGIMIHRNGVILDANMAYVRLFGYERPDQLIGRFAPNLLIAQESRARVLERIENNETAVSQATGMRKDGSTFPGEMESRPIKYRGYDATLVATRDITERTRAEEERKKLMEQLIHAHKMELMGRLAGNISHDFNNLLTVIIGSSELLLDRVVKDDPIRESLEEIYGAGQRAAGLTQQMLAFSRKQVLRPRVVDLNSLVKEMQPILERVVGDHVRLGVELKAGVSTISADPLQLDSVIMNLVVNARDAMPKGGTIQIETATVRCGETGIPPCPEDRVGDYVTLAVRDSGQGMTKELQNQIFEPFFTTKELGKGTGLGLAVTLGIVEQSGGTIEVQSEMGHGTTFMVYLPLVTEAVVESDKQEVIPGIRANATIVVAEDHEDVRKFTIAALKSYGYRVIEADSSGRVLGLINRERGRVDMILTDVVMPDLGGREMVTKVRDRWPHVRVLFMSGYSEDAVLLHGVLEKDSAFIQKPFSPSELAAKVQELLGAPGFLFPKGIER